MNREELHSAVIECVRHGMRYQQTADHLKLDKNQIYKVMKDLVETGRIIKVGKGQYALPDGPIPEYVPSKRKYAPRKKKADVVELIIKDGNISRIDGTVLHKPEPPKEDIEEIATRLLGKVGELQPLLLLHTKIFDEIEAITMELTNRIIEVKPLILTAQEMDDYQELKQIKEKAVKLAESKLKRKMS